MLLLGQLLFLRCFYSTVYMKVNTVFQTCFPHKIQYSNRETTLIRLFGDADSGELYPAPQDTYTCAVRLMSLMCLVFALVHEQVVYLKRTMSGPSSHVLCPCHTVL